MLTVKEINEVSFGKAGFSGYRPEDVDRFIDEVADSFTQLQAERDDALKQARELSSKNADLTAKNDELQQKLSVLAEKIESYRSEEDGIKDALLSAQKMARTSVQDAKDKAEIILQDARSNARQIMDDAKVDASKAAQEYMAQADAKREELEELKRQVTAFRSSLLEMYKKHLECIDHIPVFHTKERRKEEPVAADESEVSPDPEPEQSRAPVAEPPVEPMPAVEKPEAPAPKPVPQRPSQPSAEKPNRQPQPKNSSRSTQTYESVQGPTLHDRVDYSKNSASSAGFPEEDDLSDVGIDLKTYSNIPESLRREKSTHFSNLEFGDDVDLGNKKKRK